MSRTPLFRNSMPGAPQLGLAAVTIDDQIDWAIVYFCAGEFCLAIVTEDQARELEKVRPQGILKNLSGGLLWIEPAAGREKGR